MPGPDGSAWLNFTRYLRDPLGTMEHLARSHGDVVFVRFPGGHSFFFVSDPHLIRRVLVDDQAVFVKGRALQAAKRLLGEGLLTSDGEEHLRRRRLIQPLFHQAAIERYGAAMVEAADRTCAGWEDGGIVDMNREMTQLALSVVGRTIFDADVESEAPEIRAVLEAGMRVFHRFLLPGADLLWRLPLPATRAFNTARTDIDRFIQRMIEKRDRDEVESSDLLGLLLALRDPAGARLLSDRQIRDEAITLMLAGHETTAQALTWAWHLLARNPAAHGALREELATQLDGRLPTAADFARLPYARAVFLESLRLYPPVWAIARIATQPYSLGGHHVPQGGTIVMSQWVVHRDARNFDDPSRFAPERWLGGRTSAAGSYFPFAAGSRICIGEWFAMLEGTLVLATIARHWRIAPQDANPRLDPRFTLRPSHGLPALVQLGT